MGSLDIFEVWSGNSMGLCNVKLVFYYVYKVFFVKGGILGVGSYCVGLFVGVVSVGIEVVYCLFVFFGI